MDWETFALRVAGSALLLVAILVVVFLFAVVVFSFVKGLGPEGCHTYGEWHVVHMQDDDAICQLGTTDVYALCDEIKVSVECPQ